MFFVRFITICLYMNKKPFSLRKIINKSFSNNVRFLVFIIIGISFAISPLASLAGLNIQAASPAGVSGFVIDYNEAPVEGAYIYISCDDFSGEESKSSYFGYTNSLGEYSLSDIDESYIPCEDGETMKLRAQREAYNNSDSVILGTVDFEWANAETMDEWINVFFANQRTQNFIMEKLPAGWSGVVLDSDTEEPVENATFHLSCEGNTRELSSVTDEDGLYSITQAQFTGAINFLGCYYSNTFDVTIIIAKDGYLNSEYVIGGVTGNDMGASSFNFAETHNFDLSPNPALKYAQGDGTEENPFIIDTVDRFNTISLFEDTENLYFALGSNIDFSDAEKETISSFRGIFDGREYTISGIERPLFSTIEDYGVIKNLVINASLVYEYSESNVGLLANRLRGHAFVENVHTSGGIELECGAYTCMNIGGLVGEMYDNTRIYRSSSSVDLSATGLSTFYFGGLVGFVYGGSIEQSYATGEIRAISNVGGLVGAISGDSSETWISDSYATGDVYATGESYSIAGGFVGESSARILRSYATGSVFATSSPAGGFVGLLGEDGSEITTSFSTAEVVESSMDNPVVGGFVGDYYGVIRNSAWVNISGVNAVGEVYEDTYCSTLGSKVLLSGSGGCDLGFDLSAVSQLKKNGYNNALAPVYLYGEDSWDFETVWGFDQNKNDGLPYLRWGILGDISEPEPEPQPSKPKKISRVMGGSGGAKVNIENTKIDNTEPKDIPLNSGECPADLKINQGLKQGFRDNVGSIKQVKILQAHINRILAAKYNQAAGPVDGIFGPLTKQGVMRLQEVLRDTLGLNLGPAGIDGIVGRFTMDAINNSCGDIKS